MFDHAAIMNLFGAFLNIYVEKRRFIFAPNNLLQVKNRILEGAIFGFTVALIVVMAVVVILGLMRRKPHIVLEGQVETTDYRISSKVPGRVRKLYVAEGDRVKRGDTLVILDIPDIDAKEEQARAAYGAAREQKEKVDAGTRYEKVAMARETWLKAKAGLEIAEKTYGRMERLFEEGVTPAQKRDEVKAQRDAALATEQAARAGYDMALNGARREDRETARSQTEQAGAVVKEVGSYVGESVLVAQADGIVAEIFPEIGELLGTGAPIMNINTDDIWFTLNVREDFLSRFATGGTMKVYIPARDTTVEARVSLIKNVGDFATWRTTKSLEQFDYKMFEVQLRPTRRLDDLRTGMTVQIDSEQ